MEYPESMDVESESKPLDLCCENSDFLYRATRVIV